MAAGKTILVVDDDPDIVETTKAVLEAADYDVITASNGTEAIAKAKSAKPDLVVLDIMMERETEGFHVAYEMKSSDEMKHIPIIVLTAVGQKSGFHFAPETDEDFLPVDAFMEKPLDGRQLLKAIAELLQKKPA